MSLALVYGGAGQLGRVIVDALKAKVPPHAPSRRPRQSFSVVSADFVKNDAANENIALKGTSMDEDAKAVKEALGSRKVDTVITAAGGWAGGNIASASIFESSDKMIRFNLNSSLVAAHLASTHLKEGGLLVLTGSSAALGGTGGMIGYGVAKAAVHQLVASLSGPNSGLPANASVVGVLPITLDTTQNRKDMPKADFGSWTPMPELAAKLVAWAHNEGRPASGSLIELQTSGGVTKYVPITISITRGSNL